MKIFVCSMFMSHHSGTGHWIRHRLSLVIFIPLTLWVIIIFLPMVAQSLCVPYFAAQDLRAWLQEPIHGLLLGVWAICGMYHGMLCLHIMVDDYIHGAVWNGLCRFMVAGIAFVAMLLCALSLGYLMLSR